MAIKFQPIKVESKSLLDKVPIKEGQFILVVDESMIFSDVEKNGKVIRVLFNQADLTNYQTKTDDALQTNDKTIVGAINELISKDIQEDSYFLKFEEVGLSDEAKVGKINSNIKILSFGDNCVANNEGTISIGKGCEATLPRAVSIGSGCKSYANTAFTIGQSNTNYGNGTFVSGNGNTVGKEPEEGTSSSDQNAAYSIIGGSANKVRSKMSFVIGEDNKVGQIGSECRNLIVSGKANTVDYAYASIISGQYNTIIREDSNRVIKELLVVGISNKVSSTQTVVFGGNNNAIDPPGDPSGGYRLIAGTFNYAEHTQTYLLGTGLKTLRKQQILIGTYNSLTNLSSVFVVGTGTSDTDRKTAFEIRKSGDLYARGNAFITGYLTIESAFFDKKVNSARALRTGDIKLIPTYLTSWKEEEQSSWRNMIGAASASSITTIETSISQVNENIERIDETVSNINTNINEALDAILGV